MTGSDTSRRVSTAVRVYVDIWIRVGRTRPLLRVGSCMCSWVTVLVCLCRGQCELGLRAIVTPTEALLRVKLGALNNYGRLTGKTSGCMVALHEPDVRSLNQWVALHEPGRDCL